jgi:hypothetical protein
MGQHQPPTKRSLYLSVAASTLRFVIIVALVVGGVLVINQAFPESSGGGTGTIADGGGLPTASESPSPSASPSETETQTTSPAAGPTEGTVIAVFNGTGESGLAADVEAHLIEKYGYTEGQPPGNAPSTVPVTTIWYAKNSDKVEAEFLAQKDRFFRQLDVQVAKFDSSTEVDSSVQLIIYVGNDYAALG